MLAPEKPRSYITGEPMLKYTDEKIVSMILEKYIPDKKIYISLPLVKNRKGHYKGAVCLNNSKKRLPYRVRVDGEMREITFGEARPL